MKRNVGVVCVREKERSAGWRFRVREEGEFESLRPFFPLSRFL